MSGAHHKTVFGVVTDRLARHYSMSLIKTDAIPDVWKNLVNAKRAMHGHSKAKDSPEDYAAILVSKRVRWGLFFSREKRVGILLVPHQALEEGSVVYGYYCEDCEEDFRKIQLLLPAELKQLPVEAEIDVTSVAASEGPAEHIKNLLPAWGYRPSSVEMHKVVGVLGEAVRAQGKMQESPCSLLERVRYGEAKLLEHAKEYEAILVSRAFSLGSLKLWERRVCLLLVPKQLGRKNPHIDIVGLGGRDGALKVKSLIHKLADLPSEVNFVEWVQER